MQLCDGLYVSYVILFYKFAFSYDILLILGMPNSVKTYKEENAEESASRANFKLLVLFRTLSIICYIALSTVAYFLADIMMPVRVIYGEIAIFAVFNFHSFLMGREKSKITDIHIFVWLLVDIADFIEDGDLLFCLTCYCCDTLCDTVE